ncbi:hypothetical protein [Sphingorhabdus sp. M41]|uniref:hypothetical protein n=1 Tax=Sphingorhabdus sp. M41 TaxID=1806885 RepID=UPI00078D90F4|nr:hypothetical protein [Sphingorhabdus sp. M41]AMO72004.1 hypothetical protein AZE99_09215 [Sphingorhabdus sp. M41]
MFGLFDPPYRRVKDEREIRYFYSKYGEDAPVVLNERASDEALSSRDRRHWRRLARKARRHRNQWMDELKIS